MTTRGGLRSAQKIETLAFGLEVHVSMRPVQNNQLATAFNYPENGPGDGYRVGAVGDWAQNSPGL